MDGRIEGLGGRVVGQAQDVATADAGYILNWSIRVDPVAVNEFPTVFVPGAAAARSRDDQEGSA
jgi:hypothetical protein